MPHKFEFDVEPTRSSNAFLRFEELCTRLGWNTYPTNVTGKEIDAGNDSDEAAAQTVEVPDADIPLYEFLDEFGVFDYL